jgi:hypothetical protein
VVVLLVAPLIAMERRAVSTTGMVLGWCFSSRTPRRLLPVVEAVVEEDAGQRARLVWGSVVAVRGAQPGVRVACVG